MLQHKAALKKEAAGKKKLIMFGLKILYSLIF
jgi:hypothetical protein